MYISNMPNNDNSIQMFYIYIIYYDCSILLRMRNTLLLYANHFYLLH